MEFKSQIDLKEELETGALRRFEVENFRSFGSGAGINVKQLNLFIGPNGSGKSTMMSLFRLFHNAVIDGDILRIGAVLVDKYNLTTKQARPFTIRLRFDFVCFEYQYKIDERFNWVVFQMKMLVRRGLKTPWRTLLNIDEKKGAWSIGKGALNEFLHAADRTDLKSRIGSSGIWLKSTERRKLRSLATDVVCSMEHCQSKRKSRVGISIVDTQPVNLEPQLADMLDFRIRGNFDVDLNFYSVVNGLSCAREMMQALSSLNRRRSLRFLGQEENTPVVFIQKESLSKSDQAFLQGLGINDTNPMWGVLSQDSTIGEAGAVLSQNIKRIIALGLLEEEFAEKDFASLILELFAAETNPPSEQLKQAEWIIEKSSSYLQLGLIALLRGGAISEFGILPPAESFVPGFQVKRLISDESRVVSMASERGILEAISKHGGIRAWLLRKLGEKGEVVIDLADMAIACAIDFDSFGQPRLKATKNGKPVEVDQMSRGEQRLLLFALHREFNAFLEEPEAHLHPNFQSILGRVLAKGYVSSAQWSDGSNYQSEDVGQVELHNVEPDGMRLEWKNEKVREFMFIETHSDILVKAIQLEMVKRLPIDELLNEFPDYRPSTQELRQKFSEVDPFIEVTYFDSIDGNSVPRSMGLRRDGVFREEFGPGFYDESIQIIRSIFDLKNNN